MAIQYCYETRNNQIGSNEINVFNFLHMNRSGVVFTVTGSFTERTSPQDSFCTMMRGPIQQVCCDTATLDMMDQFQLPTTSYTFAVMVINNDARPLAFVPSANKYRHEQFQARLGSSAPPPGDIPSLGQDDVVTEESILLLRFILGNSNITHYNCTFLNLPWMSFPIILRGHGPYSWRSSGFACMDACNIQCME